jgi:agmatinase
MADSAVEGYRFGAANGDAAQALGQEKRHQAGFAAAAQSAGIIRPAVEEFSK